AWVILALIVLLIGVVQLTDFLPGACRGLDASAKAHGADAKLPPASSLTELINSNPHGSIVIICVNGRPSVQTWRALRRGMSRIGARRGLGLIRGASMVVIGVVDARPGSAVFKMGVQEVEVRLKRGQEIGETGVVAPREIVAKSIGDSEGIGRAVISVGGTWLSPNKVGVNVAVIDGTGRCIRRGSFG
nr:hypothetical protein [Bacillota bacterium]